jgi:hypothetical protein
MPLPRQIKQTFRKAKNRVILTAFSDTHRTIHDEFVALGQAVNKRTVSFGSMNSGEMKLVCLTDSTRPHTAVSTE